MEGYNPFSAKDLADLRAGDLSVLKEVTEGWYIEYKEQLSNAKTIAKSVSSFSNTYGGWLIYGVEEDETTNTAKSFPGLPKADLDKSLKRIQQSVAANMNPASYFETKVLNGPEPSIKLAKDRMVLCVHVPKSNDTPHVHSNGCIYRRVGAGSEPQPETDRHQLDMLWGRKRELDKEYAQWIAREPELSKGEAARPYLRLLLEGDLFRLEGKKWDLSIDSIMSTLNDPNSGMTLPIEACFPCDRGMVARQTSSLARHGDFALTWIIGSGLRCEVWVPINVFLIDEPDFFFSKELENYKGSDRFLQILQNARATNARILDLNQLFDILLAISGKYLALLDANGTSRKEIHAKVMLGGLWRSVPFLDSEIILDRFEKYGLPLSLTDASTVPVGDDSRSLYKITLGRIEDETLRSVEPALIIMELICRAVGLQGFFTGNYEKEAHPLILQLMEAGKRSRTAPSIE